MSVVVSLAWGAGFLTAVFLLDTKYAAGITSEGARDPIQAALTVSITGDCLPRKRWRSDARHINQWFVERDSA